MHGRETVSNDGITIDVSGFCKGLDVAVDEIRRKMPQTMARIGLKAVDISRDMVPVDTARLKGSIAHKEYGNGVTYETSVGSNVKYAPYVEYGTGQAGKWSGGGDYRGHDSGVTYNEAWSGVRARPYLRPSVYDFKDVYTEMVAETVREAFR